MDKDKMQLRSPLNLRLGFVVLAVSIAGNVALLGWTHDQLVSRTTCEHAIGWPQTAGIRNTC
jgi:hypothetical protein